MLITLLKSRLFIFSSRAIFYYVASKVGLTDSSDLELRKKGRLFKTSLSLPTNKQDFLTLSQFFFVNLVKYSTIFFLCHYQLQKSSKHNNRCHIVINSHILKLTLASEFSDFIFVALFSIANSAMGTA